MQAATLIDTDDTINCQLCQKSAQRKYCGHEGYQNTKSYDIYHCEHCQTAFASPLEVDNSIYNHIYNKIEKVPGYNRYFYYSQQVLKEKSPLDFLANTEDIYWAIREFLRKKNNKTLKILEVGCGFGYLTYALHHAGYDIQGLDISQTAVDNATKRYGNLFQCSSIEDYSKQNAGYYDIVIFTEVIEHIQEVKSFLQAADRLLKNNGNLVMTTPNRTPYPLDILWETEPPPVHLWWFSENSIRYLAESLGHKVTFMDFNSFNIHEIKKNSPLTSPYLAIRNFLPSRLPRLDGNGEVLNIGDYIEVEQPKQESPQWKVYVKSTLKFILKPLGILKLRDAGLKMKKIYQLKRYPQTRPTLCAIFHK